MELNYCFLPLPLLFLLLLSPCVSAAAQNDSRYVNCSKPFTCGDTEAKYPFWGGSRAEYCGRPGFELDCESDQTTITPASETFRILDFKPEERRMRVARKDFLDNTCLPQFPRTDINISTFKFATDIRNVTLFYNCTYSLPVAPSSSIELDCSINGDNVKLLLPVSLEDPKPTCPNNFTIPIPDTIYWEIERRNTPLADALREGFEVQWDDNAFEELCKNCTDSGGVCGFDQAQSQFACFCAHQPYSDPRVCSRGKGNDSKKGLAIGIAVGCFAAVGGLLCAAYLLVRRRKQLIIAQSATKDVGGGSGPPLSSNDANGIRPLALPFIASPTTPSSNYYGSTPSYYGDAKSDLENGSTYNGVRIFSYDELEEATENFDGSKELGDGGFGVVYHGKLRDGRSVAVKRLYERNFKRVEQFMNEVEILTRLRHPNLVTLYGCTSRRSRELLLVYEFISNGTLADHLHGTKASSGSLAWPVRLSVAIETADALAYLHASEIIHRDVKTNNILLDQNFHVKVADFGLSRLYPNDVTHVSTAPQGTPGYVDPEYYQCYHLTSRSDVYSFGVVLVELVSSKQAVDTSRHRHDVNLANMAVTKIQNQSLHELVDPWLGYDGDCEVRQAVKAVAELAFRCLQQERDMRPSMDEVLEGLKMIETEYNDQMKQKNKEFVKINEDGTQEDDAVPLKRNATATLSPDSVVNAKWSSSSITEGSQ